MGCSYRAHLSLKWPESWLVSNSGTRMPMEKGYICQPLPNKQRLALPGCGPVGLRRGIWDAEILSSNLSTPTTRFFRFKPYFLDFLTIYIKRNRK